MAGIEWKNEWQTRFVEGKYPLDDILNEGHENGYDVFDIIPRQSTEFTKDTVTTGTRIIFRKQRIALAEKKLSPDEMINLIVEYRKDFIANTMKIMKPSKTE